MKKASESGVERYRIRRGPTATDESAGNNGAFIVPHEGWKLIIIASDGEHTHPDRPESANWEHVSVRASYRNKKGKVTERCPTWEEMCKIKALFWADDETVMELHPPRSEWISNHNYVLHLWKPKHVEIPRPPSYMVGVQGVDAPAAKKMMLGGTIH